MSIKEASLSFWLHAKKANMACNILVPYCKWHSRGFKYNPIVDTAASAKQILPLARRTIVPTHSPMVIMIVIPYYRMSALLYPFIVMRQLYWWYKIQHWWHFHYYDDAVRFSRFNQIPTDWWMGTHMNNTWLRCSTSNAIARDASMNCLHLNGTTLSVQQSFNVAA
jgi:hypothetical protein